MSTSGASFETRNQKPRVPGAEHATTLHTMNSLACTYLMQGRILEGIELSDKTLQAVWRRLEEEQAVEQIDMVAWGYSLAGRYEQAEQLFTRGLDICRRSHGKNDWSALNLKHDYGKLCMDLGRYDEAEQLLLEALDGGRQVWAKHPETYRTMASLGWLYHAQGRYAEAEQSYVKILEIAHRIHGGHHGFTLAVMNGLGALYTLQDRYDKAKPLLTEALETGRRILGEDHPTTLQSKNDLGMLYKNQGRYQDAEQLLLEALEGRRRKLGDKHPHTLGV